MIEAKCKYCGKDGDERWWVHVCPECARKRAYDSNKRSMERKFQKVRDEERARLKRLVSIQLSTLKKAYPAIQDEDVEFVERVFT